MSKSEQTREFELTEDGLRVVTVYKLTDAQRGAIDKYLTANPEGYEEESLSAWFDYDDATFEDNAILESISSLEAKADTFFAEIMLAKCMVQWVSDFWIADDVIERAQFDDAVREVLIKPGLEEFKHDDVPEATKNMLAAVDAAFQLDDEKCYEHVEAAMVLWKIPTRPYE